MLNVVKYVSVRVCYIFMLDLFVSYPTLAQAKTPHLLNSAKQRLQNLRAKNLRKQRNAIPGPSNIPDGYVPSANPPQPQTPSNGV